MLRDVLQHVSLTFISHTYFVLCSNIEMKPRSNMPKVKEESFIVRGYFCVNEDKYLFKTNQSCVFGVVEEVFLFND